MTEWFYVREGQQNGPVSFEELVALARRGELKAGDSVWNETMQAWTPAGQVQGLIDTSYAAYESGAPPAMPSNPYAAPQSNWSESLHSSNVELSEIEYGSDVIDPMDCMSRGIEITKRKFLDIFLVGIVYLACIFGLSILSSIIELAVTGTSNQNPQEFSSGRMIVVITSQIVFQIFSIFLQLGLVRVGLNIVSGKEASIGMLFGQGSKLLRAIIASIVYGLAVMIGLLLLIVPGIYVALRYGQFLTAIVDRDLGIMEAFEYSSSITTNNRMNLFLFWLLAMVAIIIGMIPCGLGLIFIGPVVWMGGLVAYRWMQYGRDAAKDHPGTETPMLTGI